MTESSSPLTVCLHKGMRWGDGSGCPTSVSLFPRDLPAFALASSIRFLISSCRYTLADTDTLCFLISSESQESAMLSRKYSLVSGKRNSESAAHPQKKQASLTRDCSESSG